jgi:tRNA(Ile)-lysidine synthase TilS/MesJ
MNTAEETIYEKIDFFMKKHVLDQIDPNTIHWWFSLSGGKDSYAMATQVKAWYKKNNLSLEATSLTFDQWNNPNINKIHDQFEWLDSHIIDISNETKRVTNYKEGDQAPCRECSDLRRNFTDSIIQNHCDSNQINFVARGLHLTDTAISFLWRFIKGCDPFPCIIEEKKYYPFKYLYDKTFLVKPLYYVREYETQKFANEVNFTPICCNCPGCAYPSRRDIIEETVALLIKSELWEFDIQGISDLVKYHTSEIDFRFILNNSLHGVENKHNHLPDGIFEYALTYFRDKAHFIKFNNTCFNPNFDLDEIGYNRIINKNNLKEYDGIPIPRFFDENKSISKYDSMMILLMGPFWGAIGLSKSQRDYIFNLQKEYFGISLDDHYSHVIELLNSYYRSQNVIRKISKNHSIHNIHEFCNCIGCA